MKSDVGKEVLSYCNKCKSTLAHIICNMKADGNIGKVECKTCKGTHAYKDPSQVAAKKTKSQKKVSTTKARSTTSISDLWQEAINSTTSKSQAYSIRTNYGKGDIIDHPKFGPGVIDRVMDGNKIEVIFRHDIKTLVHNKS